MVEKFTYKGRRCKIRKDDRLGHYCGHIQTGLRGNINGVNVNLWRLIDVHGGITYGIDDEGWLGFDTAHAGDINKDETGKVLSTDGMYDEDDDKSTVWTPEKVKEEIKELADQWSALEQAIHNAERFEYV